MFKNTLILLTFLAWPRSWRQPRPQTPLWPNLILGSMTSRIAGSGEAEEGREEEEEAEQSTPRAGAGGRRGRRGEGEEQEEGKEKERKADAEENAAEREAASR